MKLGRKAVKTDSRTLQMARYMKALPPPPPECDWLGDVTDWGMMDNDKIGDCTCAACAHAIQVWSRSVGGMRTIQTRFVLEAYERWCGYNPTKAATTDNGGIELDVLTDWRQESLVGHKLDAFAGVNFADPGEVRQAIYLFGGVYIGLNLPNTAQQQTSWSFVPNTKDNAPGSWGGHAVFVGKYSTTGFTCITWGAPMWMSNYFWSQYCDECYALVSTDFLSAKGNTPDGLSLQQLLADVAQIK